LHYDDTGNYGDCYLKKGANVSFGTVEVEYKGNCKSSEFLIKMPSVEHDLYISPFHDWDFSSCAGLFVAEGHPLFLTNYSCDVATRIGSGVPLLGLSVCYGQVGSLYRLTCECEVLEVCGVDEYSNVDSCGSAFLENWRKTCEFIHPPLVNALQWFELYPEVLYDSVEAFRSFYGKIMDNVAESAVLKKIGDARGLRILVVSDVNRREFVSSLHRRKCGVWLDWHLDNRNCFPFDFLAALAGRKSSVRFHKIVVFRHEGYPFALEKLCYVLPFLLERGGEAFFSSPNHERLAVLASFDDNLVFPGGVKLYGVPSFSKPCKLAYSLAGHEVPINVISVPDNVIRHQLDASGLSLIDNSSFEKIAHCNGDFSPLPGAKSVAGVCANEWASVSRTTPDGVFLGVVRDYLSLTRLYHVALNDNKLWELKHAYDSLKSEFMLSLLNVSDGTPRYPTPLQSVIDQGTCLGVDVFNMPKLREPYPSLPLCDYSSDTFDNVVQARTRGVLRKQAGFAFRSFVHTAEGKHMRIMGRDRESPFYQV